MRIKVYQVDSDKDTRQIKYVSLAKAEEKGGLDSSNYRCVYHGDVDLSYLEQIYLYLNQPVKPHTYQGHSLSVSDIVEIVDEICENESAVHVAKGFYFCDIIKIKKIKFDDSKAIPMNGIRVLMIEPGKIPIETRIPDTLESWQSAVSKEDESSLMEVTYPFDDQCCVVGNEEAKLIGMQGNRHINGAVYAGPIYIIGYTGDGNFCDLTDAQTERYSKIFEKPEDISQSEVEADCGFRIISWR